MQTAEKYFKANVMEIAIKNDQYAKNMKIKYRTNLK